jgi:hypothetical protein
MRNMAASTRESLAITSRYAVKFKRGPEMLEASQGPLTLDAERSDRMADITTPQMCAGVTVFATDGSYICSLPLDVARELDAIAAARGLTQSEAIMLGLELFLDAIDREAADRAVS